MIQTGDPTGSGFGGTSIFNKYEIISLAWPDCFNFGAGVYRLL